jgi:hypothetical protein
MEVAETHQLNTHSLSLSGVLLARRAAAPYKCLECDGSVTVRRTEIKDKIKFECGERIGFLRLDVG